MTISHHIVQPGEGWWPIARLLAPDASEADIADFALYLVRANGDTLLTPLDIDRILWYDPLRVPPPASPPPPPPPSDWQAAFDSRDRATIAAWFEAHTGHTSAELLDLGSGLTIDDDWLTANDGHGHVRLEFGRWIVERVRARWVNFAANNVTLVDSHIDGQGVNAYGVTSSGDPTGIVIQDCTLDGGGTERKGVYFPSAVEPGQVIVAGCDISGYATGVYAIGGLTVEYCWVHDLHVWAGSHNTSMSIRSRNVTARRNLFTDGTSSALSLYAENSPYTGVELVENVFDVGASAIYEVNFPNDKPYNDPAPGDTRSLVGNLFGHEPPYAVSDVANFTDVSGNSTLAGTSVP